MADDALYYAKSQLRGHESQQVFTGIFKVMYETALAGGIKTLQYEGEYMLTGDVFKINLLNSADG